jgi:hypothetical protein
LLLETPRQLGMSSPSDLHFFILLKKKVVWGLISLGNIGKSLTYVMGIYIK